MFQMQASSWSWLSLKVESGPQDYYLENENLRAEKPEILSERNLVCRLLKIMHTNKT